MKAVRVLTFITLSLFLSSNLFAQVETSSEEEDYSIYDNLDYVGEGTKSFASAKISGISPARLISVGYDFQGGYDLTAGAISNFGAQTARVNSTQGLRIGANIPVISKNSLIVQLGGQIWDVNYDFENPNTLTHPMLQALNKNNLTTLGLNSTIFKPLNETNFILVQLASDMNGDFELSKPQNLKYNTFSAAAIWGKRPSDYKQWGVGLSRTYRAGELNYIPIFLFNWTSPTSKWGTELLLPARGHVRYTINRQNMLFFGFELEGNSYRFDEGSLSLANNNGFTPVDDLEIRRSELRVRFQWQRKLIGFVWIALEGGYRINYSFNVDEVPGGQDFYRGFFGDQPLAIENSLTNPLYFNVSFNLVSP